MDAGGQMEEQANDNPQPNVQERRAITRGPECWSELPSIVIQNVYLGSTQTDQVAMSLVCRSWSEVFNDAVVWRTRKLKYDITVDISKSRKLVDVAERRGKFLHHVEFTYAQFYEDITGLHASLLISFLELLETNSPLETVVFRDVTDTLRYRGNQGFGTPEVIQHIRSLLLAKNVKTAGFYNLGLTIQRVAWLLKALMSKKSCNLRYLTLENCLHRIEYEPLLSVLDLPILVSFINLETFDGTYSPLFEKIMNDIHESSEEIRSYTANKEGKLWRIRLQCPENVQFPPCRHVSPDSWATLKTMCPNLSVELRLAIMEFLTRESLIPIKQNMPLILLNLEEEWNTHSQITRIEVVLNHLRGAQIHEGLETLRIAWYDVYEGLTEELAQYLLLCTNLKTLELRIRHPVYSFDSLFRVYLINHPVELKKCKIHIKNIRNQDERSLYSAVNERYSPVLQMRGLNLELEM